MDDETRPFEFDEKKEGVNRHGVVTRCSTCGGDRFVLVRLRSPERTAWMEEHKIAPSARSFYEEYAACPDCHRIEVEYYRFNQTKFRMMDPAAVRQALSQ